MQQKANGSPRIPPLAWSLVGMLIVAVAIAFRLFDLALGLVGTGLVLWHARNAFVVFASLWAVGTLLAYSLIPYKTPWLTLNIIVPFAIVGGWAAEVLYLRAPAVWRRVLLALGVLAISISAYQAVVLNFVRYDDDRYAYVYAHTRRAVLDLTSRIDEIRARAGSGLTIAVVSPDQFPLSWYLRDYRAGYYGSLVRTNHRIYIGSEKQDEALRAQLGDGYVRIGSYSLRPGVDLVLYVRRDLAFR
jgi:predicted membrane-bound mannosyltransferase